MKSIVLSLLLLWPTVATAQSNTPLVSLKTPAEALPWQAVGRLNMGNGFCTGTLITRSLVLTAAHCVYDRGTLREADSISFQAGYRNGRAVATRKGKRIVTHADYVDDGLATSKIDTVATDIAVIELSSPIIDAAVVPFERHRQPPVDARVVVVSYARGRTEVPALEDGCKMFERYKEALLYTCDVDFGASGAPVFTITTAGPKIASVMSGSGGENVDEFAVGAPMGAAVDRMVRQLQTTNVDPRFVKSTTAEGAFNRRTVASRSGLPQISR